MLLICRSPLEHDFEHSTTTAKHLPHAEQVMKPPLWVKICAHASTDQTAVTWAPSLTRFFTDIGHFSMILMHQEYLQDICSKYSNWFYHNLFYKNELDVNVHGPVWSQIQVSLELIRGRLSERSRSVTDSCINSLTSGNNKNVAVPDVSWYQNGG